MQLRRLGGLATLQSAGDTISPDGADGTDGGGGGGGDGEVFRQRPAPLARNRSNTPPRWMHSTQRRRLPARAMRAWQSLTVRMRSL
jgi:hypothetical protein